MARRKPTLMEVAYKNSKSVTTAMNALRFVVEYGQACDDNDGREIEITEYGTHIGVATSLAYRRRDSFRKCFPGSDPLEIWMGVRPSLKRSSFAHENPV